jgi:amino acid adenylation domain-containing protein/non-ribosomal peptide synthase protein (TIGR01720 family)
MSQLLASIAELTPQQRAALELRLRQRRSGARAAVIPRRPRPADPCPLSFAQERLWLLQQMMPESAAYNVHGALRARGPLAPSTLAGALGAIVDRHQVLRSSFPLAGERPVMVSGPPSPWRLPEVDLTALAAERRETAARRLVEEQVSRPFDLIHGPVLRSLHLRLAAGDHLILLLLHHVVSDGWSMEILLRELAACYAAGARRQPSRLPELPIQYADFAVWQRAEMSGGTLAAQLGYWRERLAGAPAVIELPFDRPRPAAQSFRGDSLTFQLPDAALGPALRELSRRHGTTLFMTLLAVFQVLLHRYTGQPELVVGSPIANRNRVELEGLIGCFANVLALRLGLLADCRFTRLLAAVREVTLGAYAHQDLPFEKLVEELRPERSLGHQPLFQVVFSQEAGTGEPLAIPGLALSPFTVESAPAKFDWVLIMGEGAAGLGGSLGYCTDLFDRASIHRAVEHLGNLLLAVAADPERGPWELPMLSAAARHQALREWNSTAARYDGERRIHELFEARAAAAPGAAAVVDRDGWLSYGELDARASRLARRLRALGVGAGASVAVLLERSAAMVVAPLAILKAGGAYVPLEARFGAARIHWILAALAVRWVVTESSQRAFLGGLEALPALERVLAIDDEPSAGPAERRPGSAGELDDGRELPRDPAAEIAYTIFTSGSTGTPKGVQVCHRPVVNLVEWVNRSFAVGAADRLLFITSLCFDLSVYDLFGVLAAGGSIRVAAAEEVGDPERLSRILQSEPITLWDSAPAALQQLVPFLPGGPAPGGGDLRLVFLSGDWIPVTLPDRVRATFPAARVIGLGGATEATVWSNCFPVGAIDPAWPSIPYGRPIQNARYLVLDRELGICPVGLAGELYIGGECLSLGYAAEPALTARQYLPDAHGEEPGARLYRTGDRARLHADGNVELLGRLDQQLKIRGFRIEAGEIEVALRQHPAIGEVVVGASGAGADKRLIAYVLATPGGRPTVGELRGFLKDRLPDYMVPAAFVYLESLPSTANGKLDRQALAAAAGTRAELGADPVAPRTAAEERLAAIWRQVLGLPSVGVHDNFFELGGDSILAIQVASRAGQAGLRLSVRQTFQHQTIAELAGAVGTAAAVAAEQGPVVGDLPLTPIQHWFFAQQLAEPHHFNLSLLFDLRERLSAAGLERAVRRLVRHHDALRLRFAAGAAGWRQTCAPPEPAAPFGAVDLAALRDELQDAAVEAAAARLQASLDLTRGPLFRIALLQGGHGRPDRLLVVVHHLAVDGLSWRILLEDLATAYRQAAAGEAVALPAKTTSFRQWAWRLVEHAQGEALRAEAPLWLGLLPRQPPPLPLDDPAAPNTFASLRFAAASLDAAATRALLAELPAVFRTTIDEVLLAALVQAFGRWTGVPALFVELEGHGREALSDDVDVSRTVGWFTSVFPLLLELPAGGGRLEGLRAVKEQLRRIPRHGVGYGLLRYLGADEDTEAGLRGCPSPAVSFNYFGQLDQTLPPDSPWTLSRLSKGTDRSPSGRRRHLLEITAQVLGGRLEVQVAYSGAIHRPATIEALTEDFAEELQALAASAGSPASRTLTASDFPLARLSDHSFDKLAALIDGEGGGEQGEEPAGA